MRIVRTSSVADTSSPFPLSNEPGEFKVRDRGSGFGAQGSGFRVQGSGFAGFGVCRVQGSQLGIRRVQGSGFRVRQSLKGFGLKVQGSGFGVCRV